MRIVNKSNGVILSVVFVFGLLFFFWRASVPTTEIPKRLDTSTTQTIKPVQASREAPKENASEVSPDVQEQEYERPYHGDELSPYDSLAVTETSPNFKDARVYYLDNLELAKDGDSTGMYRLYAMSKYCGVPEPHQTPSEYAEQKRDDLQLLVDKGIYEESASASEEARISVCSEVWPIMEFTSGHWLDQATESGDPIVEFRQKFRLEGAKNMEPEEISRVIGNAVKTKEPLILASVYHTLFDYEEGTQSDIERTIQHAWEHLACSYRHLCNTEVLEDSYSRFMYPYQVYDILRESEALANLIDFGEIDKHDFHSLASDPNK